MPGGDPAHLLDHPRAQPVPAQLRIHHRCEGRHRIGRPAKPAVGDAARDDLRDPVREVGGGAVPAEGNGIPDRDHAAPCVPEAELELGEVRPSRDVVEEWIQLGVLEEPGPRAEV
jgi:hypothetical protein